MRISPSFYLSFLLLLLSVAFFSCKNPTAGRQELYGHFTAKEDSSGTMSEQEAFSQLHAFQPLSSLPLKKNTAVYWLAAPLEKLSDSSRVEVISFSSLTYVDLFLFSNGKCILHKKSGAFREQRELAKEDGRFWITLPQHIAGSTLLLRVKHTKNYSPQFNFGIQSMYDFFQWKQSEEAVELRLQGVLWIFLAYTLLCWLATRNRVYGWLLLTITAVTFYNLCPSGYFIEWFFPEAPLTGWIFNVHFVHVGMIGLHMLAIDFWKIRQQDRPLYTACMTSVGFIVLTSIVSFCIDFFTGNYALTTYINLWTYVIHIIFSGFVIWRLWPKLDSTQKYLAYGIFTFIASCIFVSIRIVVLKEHALANITYFSSIMIISVFFLLSIGITKSLNRAEKEKQLALENLNKLKEEQNTILEEKVKQQTAVLKNNNARLITQNKALEDRSQKIAILSNELSHRVKNNLQLLYSLISLQLPGIRDEASREILKSNISRIKAMILVNRGFYQLEKSQYVDLAELTRELAINIKQIYSMQISVSIEVDFDEGIEMDSKNALYFSLVLSELMTNSFKYAFHKTHTGVIHISGVKKEDVIVCRYADSGEASLQKTTKPSSIGLSLVKDLVRQMNGELLEYADPGFVYELTVPIRSIKVKTL